MFRFLFLAVLFTIDLFSLPKIGSILENNARIATAEIGKGFQGEDVDQYQERQEENNGPIKPKKINRSKNVVKRGVR